MMSIETRKGMNAARRACAIFAVALLALSWSGIAVADAVTDALRILEKHDSEVGQSPEEQRRRSFLYPTPAGALAPSDFHAFLQSGAQSMEGIDVRRDLGRAEDRFPYFEGTFKRIHHPFIGRDIVTYDEGVYAVPGDAAYVGKFTYFPKGDLYSQGAISHVTMGSFVIVGKKVHWDGRAENGLFIAEDVVAGFSLNILTATPEYLQQFERRHAAAVARQKELLARQQQEQDFDFGSVLALGLGAALIGGSDLSRLDKLNLAETFLSDLAGGGDGRAVFDAALSQFDGGDLGGGFGGGLFSGNRVFEAPGLNEAMDALIEAAVTGPNSGGAGASGIAGGSGSAGSGAIGGGAGGGGATGSSAATGPVATASAPPPGYTTETYTFQCPMSGPHSIPVTYRNGVCGEAMKYFARVYSCNLIDEFEAAGQRCQRDCGHPQCAEVE